jgi:hypothetical protein
MRLPINYSGAFGWTTRGLIYVISWLSPSSFLPIPIAQIVFPIEKATRIASLLEVGKVGVEIIVKEVEKEIAKEVRRPSPNTQDRKLKAFKSKMNARVNRGNIGVTIDELIDAGEIQIELLHDNFVLEQLPSGDYHITITWNIPNPGYYALETNQGITQMQIQDIPPEGITVSETFLVTAVDFHQFCVDLAQQVRQRVKTQLIQRECSGINKFDWIQRFDKDPDPGSRSLEIPENPDVGVNTIFHETHETRECTSPQKEFSSTPNIGVETSPMVDTKNDSPLKVSAIVAFPFIVYLLVAYSYRFLPQEIQNFLKKFSKK